MYYVASLGYNCFININIYVSVQEKERQCEQRSCIWLFLATWDLNCRLGDGNVG
jgi:hypothetical protein